MVPKVIKSEEEYERDLGRIGELMDAAPGTPEGDELELLATLVELYEKDTHPIDAVEFRMEQAGLKQKDLSRSSAAAARSPRCCRAGDR